MDCSDVSDAATLIGRAKNQDAVKAKIIAFAEKKGCSIPDAWKETSKMAVTFALESGGRRVDGEWAIYPNATLFVAGDYEDKGYSMSPEEMWAACEQFTNPVGGNIEHSDFLKGRACEVRSIRLDDEDSSTLRGEVAVPLWLDAQLEAHERKLSCEWDRSTKTLSGIGLVVHPRVPEAALMSAYTAFAASKPMDMMDKLRSQVEAIVKLHQGHMDSTTAPSDASEAKEMDMLKGVLDTIDSMKMAVMNTSNFVTTRHDTPQGQQAMQAMHDMSAQAGAVCSKSNANMASAHEASAIQKIHDMATEHGAACSSTKSGGLSFPSSMYSATPATSTATTSPKEGRKMSNWDRFVAAISGMKDEDAGETTSPVAPPPSAPQVPVVKLSASNPDLDAARSRAEAATQRADALEAENRRLQQERIMERAVTFADRMLAETRALPAEREFIIADFVQRATDDTLYGVVNFGEGKTTTRVGLLEAQFAARSPHKLTAAEITPALFSILQGHRDTPAQDAGNREATPDELRKMIEMTTPGKALMSQITRGAPSAPNTNGKV